MLFFKSLNLRQKYLSWTIIKNKGIIRRNSRSGVMWEMGLKSSRLGESGSVGRSVVILPGSLSQTRRGAVNKMCVSLEWAVELKLASSEQKYRHDFNIIYVKGQENMMWTSCPRSKSKLFHIFEDWFWNVMQQFLIIILPGDNLHLLRIPLPEQ